MTNKNFISKSELIRSVANDIGVPVGMTGRVIDGFLEAIKQALCDQKRIKIVGFGKFETRKRHARRGVNPQNPREEIQIPEVIVPKFTAGKPLKDKVKGR